MIKNNKYKNLLIDVDGVMTDGKMYYTEEGKLMKIFGPDDHEALKMIQTDLNIRFLSADERGFGISKKRITDDMGFGLNLISSEDRLGWIEEKYGLDGSIYIGDSFVDIEISQNVGFSIAPSDANKLLKENVDLILENKGGDRAVSEACFYIKENLI
jgi:3-deoxy-D-manno-octulosonate 8-phosphate phosphatase (KDO 8-P phosphatase)